MKYDINFYSDELKPKTQLFNLAFCIIIVVLTLASVFTVGDHYATELRSKQQSLAVKQGQLNGLQDQLKALQTGQTAIKQDAQQVANYDTLSNKLEFYQQLNQELKGQPSNQQQSFSSLMLALAEYHEPTISLSSIRVDNGQVRFEGATDDSASVPAWLASLSQSQWFSAREFSQTRIYRDKDDQLQFVIGSTLGDNRIQAQGN